MKYKKNTYMQFYIAIGIAGIGPYRLCLLPWNKLEKKFFNGDPSPISPQVASLYQPWLGKRLFSDKRL
jgi:hypothetical protein